MSNDLISREALKKAFLNHSCTEFEIKNMCRTDEHVIALIDNAPTVDMSTELSVAYLKGRRQGQSDERPQGELKEYKPLELDYNVKSAVKNLKTAYWSNDTEKYAKAFTEAEQIIINAICHYGYIVLKGGAE